MSLRDVSIEQFTDRMIRARTRIKALVKDLAEKLPPEVPPELIEPLTQFGLWRANLLNAFPSDEAVRQLIKACFYASMETDEKRLCRVSLPWGYMATSRGSGSVLIFKEPIPLTQTTIAKLAHATTRHTALSLSVKDGVFVIDGITERQLVYGSYEATLGVLITIVGPGIIEYHEAGYGASFRHGKSFRLIAFWKINELQALFAEIEKRQRADSEKIISQIPAFDEALTKLNLPKQTLGETGLRVIADLTVTSAKLQIRTILRSIQAEGHGGMVAVCDGEVNGVDRRYPTCSSNLSQISGGKVLCQIATAYIGKPLLAFPVQFFFDNWVTYGFLESVAALSGIDGCLILNPNMEVVEMGAVVESAIEDAKAIRIVNAKNECISDDFYRHRGTRHRAAINLCARNEGAIVFLVSQDGDIRVFIRQPDKIVFRENLSAW